MDEQLNSQALQALQKQMREHSAHLPGPTIVAVGLTFPENVGSVLRLADAAGCPRVLLLNGSDARSSEARLQKTARNSEATVKWETWQQAMFLEQAASFQPLIGLEITTNSQNLLTTALPSPCSFVIGSERNGIPSDILAQCHQIVHIPMFGVNSSMNVTHALAIALFEWRRQWAV